MLDIIINILHLIVFIAAVVIFGKAVLYRLNLVSKGQKVDNLAPMEARIRSFIFNVIFQMKQFKHPLRGTMHAMVFYGFVVYLVHTMGQMIAGNFWALFPSQEAAYEFTLTKYTGIMSILFQEGEGSVVWFSEKLIFIIPILIAITFFAYSKMNIDKDRFVSKKAGLQWFFAALLLLETGFLFIVLVGSGTHFYETMVQYFSVFVLIGLAFFAGRRWIFKAKGLDVNSTPSAIVIGMIGLLMISTLLSANCKSEGVRNFFWWVHLASVYSFMIYVPTSKHSHLIFAPMNYFMVKDAPRGQINWMDLEDENGVWGAGNATELKWTSLLDGMSCIECGRCTIECPANRTGKPLNPKRIMTEVKHSMLDHATDILNFTDEGNAPSPVVGEPYITAEELWSCTTCMACVEACPVGNNQVESILDMRRHLVQVESSFPQELQLAFQNMENQSNPWGIGAHTRADWCKDMDVKVMADNPEVDVLYWVGCAGSFDDRNIKIARSFTNILQKAGVNFGILGTEEGCTGDSARRGGNEYLFQTMAAANIELLNKYKFKKIVTACPHCMNTLKNEYPQMGGNYEVVHHSEFINELIDEGKIEVDSSKLSGTKTTLHDSCYLGRYNDIYNEPRGVIEKATGKKAVECSDTGSTSMCCGAGGAAMWMEEKYERINVERTKQLTDTGADTVSTACPFCVTMIYDGVKDLGKEESVKVLDIAEIVESGLK